MFKKNANKIGTAFIAVLILFGLVVIRAQSAETKDSIGMTGAQNSNILFVMGVSGAWEPELPEGIDMFHPADDPLLALSGRLNIYDLRINPPFGMPFFYVHPLVNFFPFVGNSFACWNLQVDDGDGGWNQFAVTGNMGILGNEQDGGWREFYTPTNAVYHIKRFTTVPVTDVRCQLETRLMHDTVKFTWTITNDGLVNRYAGLKFIGDVTTQPIGDGNPNLFVPGHNFFDAMTVLQGTDIPEMVEVFDNPQNPSVSQRYILKGNGATQPDVIGLDDWGVISSDLYSYFGAPTNPLFVYEPPPFFPIGDKAVALLWKPRVIPPGRSIKIVSYIGVGKSTALYDKPSLDNPQFVPAVEGPRALPFGSVQDIDNNPSFEVRSYFDNQDKFMSMTGGTASLVLPDGLELDPDDTEGYTKSFGTVAPGSESRTAWNVIPTGRISGILEYSVSMNASPVGGAVVKRTINIPATPTQRMAQSWQMISMPFDTQIDDDAPPPAPGGAPGGLAALGIPGEFGVDFKLFEYDTKAQKYITPTRFVPGTGYWLWLKNPNVSTANVEGWTYTPLTWNSTTFKQFELRKGWNLISNPFVYTVTLGECYFYHPNFGTLNYEQAVASALISKTLYTYDTIFQKYRSFSNRAVQIKPWVSYWIKVLQPQVTILISPASQIGANLGGGSGFIQGTTQSVKPAAESNDSLNQAAPVKNSGSGTTATKEWRKLGR